MGTQAHICRARLAHEEMQRVQAELRSEQDRMDSSKGERVQSAFWINGSLNEHVTEHHIEGGRRLQESAKHLGV